MHEDYRCRLGRPGLHTAERARPLVIAHLRATCCLVVWSAVHPGSADAPAT
jgi:hypothetical protein